MKGKPRRRFVDFSFELNAFYRNGIYFETKPTLKTEKDPPGIEMLLVDDLSALHNISNCIHSCARSFFLSIEARNLSGGDVFVVASDTKRKQWSPLEDECTAQWTRSKHTTKDNNRKTITIIFNRVISLFFSFFFSTRLSPGFWERDSGMKMKTANKSSFITLAGSYSSFSLLICLLYGCVRVREIEPIVCVLPACALFWFFSLYLVFTGVLCRPIVIKRHVNTHIKYKIRRKNKKIPSFFRLFRW